MHVVGLINIVALRNENGSYNQQKRTKKNKSIVALRNENGSYNDNKNAQKK